MKYQSDRNPMKEAAQEVQQALQAWSEIKPKARKQKPYPAQSPPQQPPPETKKILQELSRQLNEF